MKTFTKLALGIALLFGITSCASATATGKIKTGEIPVSKDYTDLTVSSAINIVWSETATSATLKADEAVYDKVIFERREGELKIYVKTIRGFKNVGPIDVILPASPVIKDIELGGASTFKSATTLSVHKLDLEVNGASEFEANIVAANEIDIECTGASKVFSDVSTPDLSVNLSGASEAYLSGTAGITEIETSGASSLNPYKGNTLTTGHTETEQSGSSKVTINCTGTLKCEASGASSLRHGPAAQVIYRRTSGAASVSE